MALVLWSQGYGTGKTHLASAIANEARRRGWIVESWLMPEFLSKMRASYQRGPLVITTNIDIVDLARRVGGAAFSRLWEMTGCGQRIVNMCGPDFRFGNTDAGSTWPEMPKETR